MSIKPSKPLTEMSLAELEAFQNQLANATPSGGIKIAEKGGISFYGLMRFPVTLYANAWVTLIERAVEVLDLITSQSEKLSWKSEEMRVETLARVEKLRARLA